MFYKVLEKCASKRKDRKARIAVVRSSLGGDESVSNATANEYIKALRGEGYDIDEIDLKDVPFADDWDSDFKEKARKRLKDSQATVFATPVYNWGPSARLNAYLQNAVKSGQDPYRPYAVLGAAGSERSQGYLHSLQNQVAMEDRGINVGPPLVATGKDVIYDGDRVTGVSPGMSARLSENAKILGALAQHRLK